MTERERYKARCQVCETVVDVSDWRQPDASEAGRYLLVHAPFSARCEGSGLRADVWWREGEGPGSARA